MKNESKTLFIPLYGKAYASRRGLLLHDPKAEALISSVSLDLTGKSRSKWLAFNMAMRSAVMDELTEKYTIQNPGCAVICPGCGLDARVLRVKTKPALWYDLDFPDVIALRRQYFEESPTRQMIGTSVTDLSWLNSIDPGIQTAVVVAEGLAMYLSQPEVSALFLALQHRFKKTAVIMDTYTTFGVKASKYKNPVNSVGASITYGLDDPAELESIGPGIRHVEASSLTPASKVNELSGMERTLFRLLFCGKLTGRLYQKLYQLHVFEIIKAAKP